LTTFSESGLRHWLNRLKIIHRTYRRHPVAHRLRLLLWAAVAGNCTICLEDWITANPLNYAVHIDSEELVDYLLQSGGRINKKGPDPRDPSLQNAPLHLAVSRCSYSRGPIPRKLIRKGANVNLGNSIGQTPLLLAVQHKNNLDCIRMLIKAGADVTICDQRGQTPLHSALQHKDNLDCIRMLIQAGADVNAANHNRVTPLLAVANHCSKPLYESYTNILIEAGAQVNVADKKRQNTSSRSSCS